MSIDSTSLHEAAENFVKMSSPELFAIDYSEIADLQLQHFRRRFRELRARVPALRRLAEDVEIDEIRGFDDLASIAFPHTMYKSYAVTDITQRRFDKLTKWLQAFTAHDLSRVDVTGCDTLDDWMDRLEAQTALRPLLSSGTSGKISMFPRSTVEEPFFLEHILRMLDPYRDEPTVDLRSGRVPFFTAWPSGYGRHNFPIIFRLLRKHVYADRNEMLVTLSDHHMSAEELWLGGKLRRAELLGEKLDLSAREQQLARKIVLDSKRTQQLWDRFIERAVASQKGKTVLYFGAWIHSYQLAKACQDRGIKIEWSPESVVFTGGGTKGFSFPDGWMDTINEVFPFRYPDRFREGYGMTETTAMSMRCFSGGHMHPLPWGIQHVVDPKTGRPLPRKGIQRGRLLVLDLLPTTYWSGTATGDEVTINWDGGCGCGRQGPYFLNEIRRLSEAQGGDDKITCAKTPQAFERLEEFLSR